MSTTSAIHLHPFDPSASVSREVHDEHPVENGNKQKHDHTSTDDDLDRLAASIRWVQRAEAATRLLQSPKLSPLPVLAAIAASDHLPRAPQLSSVSRLTDADDRRYRREMLAPHLLKPERLMPSPTVYRGDLFWPISVLMVLVMAAPIAYHLLLGRYGPISAASVEPQLVALDSTSIAAPLRVPFQETQPTMFARDDALMARAEGEILSAPASRSCR
jgi:hypothetical protein